MEHLKKLCRVLWKQIKTSQMRTEAIYPGLAIVYESATMAWFGKDSKAVREWGSFIGDDEGKAQVCSDWRVLAWGSWRWANYK